MARTITETTPFLPAIDLNVLDKKYLENLLAYQKARTHEERYRLNRELTEIRKQYEEAAA